MAAGGGGRGGQEAPGSLRGRRGWPQGKAEGDDRRPWEGWQPNTRNWKVKGARTGSGMVRSTPWALKGQNRARGLGSPWQRLEKRGLSEDVSLGEGVVPELPSGVKDRS